MGNSNGGAGYDSEPHTYHAMYDPDTPGSLSVTIISLVSEAVEKEPEAMDPLFEVVDPEALDRLFRSREARTGRVEFKFCGCEVTAKSEGEVVVSATVDDE